MAPGHQQDSQDRSTRSASPLLQRRTYSTRSLEQRPPIPIPDETSSLLDNADGALWGRSYRSIGPSTPGTPRFQRQPSYSTSTRFARNYNRGDSYTFSQRLVNALSSQDQRRDTGLGELVLSVLFYSNIMEVLTLCFRFKSWSIQILYLLHKRSCLV
jgi:hypothetical protein